jgi:phage portal protein BeeE
LFGGSTSGKSVNERSAMQMTAVYACVRALDQAVLEGVATSFPQTEEIIEILSDPPLGNKRYLNHRILLPNEIELKITTN